MKDLKTQFIIVLKGFCMGAADVVPGVSGGTMAFILGIYARVLAAIKSFDRQWLGCVLKFNIKEIFLRPHLSFLIPLTIGILSALLFFTRIVPLPRLLIDYPEPVYGLFFGLICGSIVVLHQDLRPFTIGSLIPALVGFIFGYLVVNMVPMETPDASWFIFICGAIATCALILPGLSGSFILLMLNKYAYIFNAVGHFNFSILIPFGLGVISGLIMFSRLMHYLLQKYFRNMVLFIIGVLVASLWVIWPFQNRVYEMVREKSRLMDSIPYFPMTIDIYVLFTMLMMSVGFITVYAISHIASNKNARAGNYT